MTSTSTSISVGTSKTGKDVDTDPDKKVLPPVGAPGERKPMDEAYEEAMAKQEKNQPKPEQGDASHH